MAAPMVAGLVLAAIVPAWAGPRLLRELERHNGACRGLAATALAAPQGSISTGSASGPPALPRAASDRGAALNGSMNLGSTSRLFPPVQ